MQVTDGVQSNNGREAMIGETVHNGEAEEKDGVAKHVPQYPEGLSLYPERFTQLSLGDRVFCPLYSSSHAHPPCRSQGSPYGKIAVSGFTSLTVLWVPVPVGQLCCFGPLVGYVVAMVESPWRGKLLT